MVTRDKGIMSRQFEIVADVQAEMPSTNVTSVSRWFRETIRPCRQQTGEIAAEHAW